MSHGAGAVRSVQQPAAAAGGSKAPARAKRSAEQPADVAELGLPAEQPISSLVAELTDPSQPLSELASKPVLVEALRDALNGVFQGDMDPSLAAHVPDLTAALDEIVSHAQGARSAEGAYTVDDVKTLLESDPVALKADPVALKANLLKVATHAQD